MHYRRGIARAAMSCIAQRMMKVFTPPTSIPQLHGDRVTLRRPRGSDVDDCLAIGRHKEIIECYGGTFDPSAPFTREHAERAIAFIENQPWAWVIDIDGFVGHLRFHNMAALDRRATLAIGIDNPVFLGKGYGTEAIRLALSHAFESGLHRVSLRVLAHNARAISAYRKCGFREEGREREAAFVNGAWQDDIIMGLLCHEFGGL